MAAKKSRQQRKRAVENEPGKQRSSLKPFYILLGVIALVGVTVLIIQAASGGQTATQPVPLTLGSGGMEDVEGVTLGDPDAPVEIIEFADYQCPACGQFATMVAPLVKERYVDQGIVRYTYYDYPLSQHQHAFLASRAARCAGDQDRYWDYHDILYARQARWSPTGNATSLFEDYSEELGLDEGAFRNCLRSDRHAETVTENLQLGVAFGVQGTPTIIVDGQIQPDFSFASLEQAIEQARESTAGEAEAPLDADVDS